jgi:hypothetical protein
MHIHIFLIVFFFLNISMMCDVKLFPLSMATLINMATAGIVNKIISLSALPQNLSTAYLPYEPTLRQKQRARRFQRESYLHDVHLSETATGVQRVDAHCYRSQRKNAPPHKLQIDVAVRAITEAHCNCKAG